MDGEHSPGILHPVTRRQGRARIGLSAPLPFVGVDIWNAYELSWLDAKGKPAVAMGELRFPVNAPNLVESKSVKLYLNSLNATRFESARDVAQTVQSDLERVAGAAVTVRLYDAARAQVVFGELPGLCLDDLDFDVTDYDVNPDLLRQEARATAVDEALHTHLFKSNCPITGQPDWASVLIRYRGARIDHRALLAYLVSYRNDAEFHEHCVERIFADVLRRCEPEALTVYARYTRRGGLDINPFRSNFEPPPDNVRLARQ